MEKRWTIRGVDPEAITLVQEVSASSGETLGVLVSDAIYVWYAGLPEADEDAQDTDMVELHQLLSEQRMLLEQLGQRLS